MQKIYKYYYLLLSFFLLVCIVKPVHGKETPIIINGQKEIFLNNSQVTILEDSTKTLTINDVSSPGFGEKFKNNYKKDQSPYIAKASSFYWVRFKIKSNEQTDKRYIIENLDEHIEHFEFYKPAGNGRYELEKTGFALPFKEREYSHKNFVFDIDPDTSVKTYYIKAASKSKNPLLFKVKRIDWFVSYSNGEYILLGVYYGILAIMAIYNLLLFFSLRDKIYLYYLFYVICCVIISTAEDGLGFQYLWPNHPNWNPIVSISAPLILILSFALYSKSFLELKTYFPKINKTINIILVAYIATFLFNSHLFNLKWNSPFFILPFLIIYITSIFSLKNGFRPARFYLIAYSFMMVGIMFLILRMGFNIIWDNIVIVYAFNIGMVFEIVILSFALADRIKIIRKEKDLAQQKIIVQLQENEILKDQVNRELEGKVLERTKEIKEINLELKFKNNRLNDYNEALEEKNDQLVYKNHELEITYDQLKVQAEEIKRMNLLLGEDKKTLETNVKELVKARVMLKKVDFEEFGKMFPDKESCFTYVAELKWADGYKCKKCGNTNFCFGKELHSRRCTKCRYNESAIAYTIFKKLKFPIVKAFYILFLVYANKGEMSSVQLSQILSLRQSTCWIFSKKVIETMKARKKQSDKNEADGWSLLILDHEE